MQMELVKLKMRARYKTAMAIIAVLIALLLLLGITYLFYDKVLDSDSDIEVTGALSINYMDGKRINVSASETVNFSITNSAASVNYYNIGFLKVRGSGEYKIMYKDTLVMEGTLDSIDELTTDYISIDAGETRVYSIEITNNGENNLTSTLNIRDYQGKTVSFSDTVLKNSNYSESSLTKVGVDLATDDEGLIKSSDDIGVSYYFRGNVQNNYVSFANLTWRIVRINGDGTVRLVLDGVADSLSNYYSDSSAGFSFNSSLLKSYLDDWYQLYLKDYTDYIANSKFCSDIAHDDNYTFNAYTRVMTNKIPTLNCLDVSISSNIGTLTIDEVLLAGANTLTGNSSYYLYNSSIDNLWYTMSGAKGTESSINMFMVDSSGNIKTATSGNLYRNVRPVINLVKNTQVTGTGTALDPYKIVE